MTSPTSKGRKVCAECERRLPITDFKQFGNNRSALCRICRGLKRGTGPEYATKEDSRYVGAFPDTASQVFPKRQPQEARLSRNKKMQMRGVDIDAIYKILAKAK